MWTCSDPTSGRSEAISSCEGTRGVSLVMPHAVTSGAIVISNAPPVSSLSASALCSSCTVSSESSAEPVSFSVLISLPARVRERRCSRALLS